MKSNWIITFAVGSILANYYIVLLGMTNLEARYWAKQNTKGAWCGVYPLEELETIRASYPSGFFELVIPEQLRYIDRYEFDRWRDGM